MRRRGSVRGIATGSRFNEYQRYDQVESRIVIENLRMGMVRLKGRVKSKGVTRGSCCMLISSKDPMCKKEVKGYG